MEIRAERPLLTLAIPTFNRLSFLRLLIETAMHQLSSIDMLGDRLELLVCNNASTDGTADYLNKLANSKGVRVIHHGSNCGAEANFVSCCEAAEGKYVWIMGDDDVPLEGAIQAVVECLERESPDLLYLPARWIFGDLGERAKSKIRTKDVSSVDSMGLAVRSTVFVTFVSSWVMNMDAYKSHVQPPRIGRYQGTSLVHLEWILTLLVEGRRLLCAEDEWILARAAGSGEYAVFEAFSLNYNRIIDEKLSTHAQLRDFLKRCMLLCFIPGLVWGVRQKKIGNFGDFDGEHVMSVLRAAYGNSVFLMLIVAPIVRFYLPIAWGFKSVARVMAKVWLFSHRGKRRPQAVVAAAGN